MGEAEVRLFESWMERLSAADDPLEFYYEHIWAPDIDYRAVEGAIDDAGPLIGRDAMRDYAADWYEMFPNLQVVPEEIIDGGPECLIVIWHMTGTAKASGVPTDLRYAAAYRIRGARIVRGREYLTREDAFAAVTAG